MIRTCIIDTRADGEAEALRDAMWNEIGVRVTVSNRAVFRYCSSLTRNSVLRVWAERRLKKMRKGGKQA